jgi:hypothetical protein
MACPLCGADAVVAREELGVAVTCSPCGGSFAMTNSAVAGWARMHGAASSVAIELARRHLADMRRSPEIPHITVDNVLTWGATS